MIEKYTTEEVFKKTLEYFNGDELATKAWINKYCLKDSYGNLYESNPDDMHKRIAKEIYRIEQKYPNPLSEEQIYNLIKDFKYIIPGGGSMSGIGNNLQISSLSNCFVIGNEYDSYGGIIRTDEEQIQLMKRRGGTGHDLSHIRPNKTPVKNSALTSTGVVPFMERYSNTTREVAQDGRRGALMLSLSIKHPDSEAFIDAKMVEGKITGANVSIKLTDEFMNAVKDDKPFLQTYPINGDKTHPLYFVKEIDAKRLWEKIVHNAWKSAEPGILFWNTIIKESPADCYSSYGFKTISTNPCGEIPMCAYDSCRLLSLNLYSYIINPFTKDAEFDIELFKIHSQYAQRIIDDIIDLELEKIDLILNKIISDNEPDNIKSVEYNLWIKIKDMAINGRRSGLGITAEGDMLAALGLCYGSEEAINMAEQIHKTLSINAYKESILLAEDRGSFKVWDRILEINNPFVARILNELPEDIIKKYLTTGRRNISCLTIAPNGTVSMMTQTTSGIEPVFDIRYKRKRKVNPNDQGVDMTQVDYDKQGDAWEKYQVFHPKFIEFAKINNYKLDNITDEEFQKIYEKSPYYKATSRDVDWVAKVKMQGTIQQWIDHSISVTANLPNNITEDIVSQVYMTAWKSGCKGITVYREGSRDGILVSNDANDNKATNINQFNEVNAPRRPKILDADVIYFNNKGEKWVGVLGVLNGRPYEIFTGKLDAFNIPTKINKGWVIRTKEDGNSRYDFQYSDDDGYKTTMEGLNRAFNREYWNYGRLISGILRHGMPIQYVYWIVDELKLADINSNDMYDWKSGVKRLIKKYIKDGTDTKDICPECGAQVVFGGDGCKKCSENCGWSRCEM